MISVVTVVTFVETVAMREGTRNNAGQAFLPVPRRLLFILETKEIFHFSFEIFHLSFAA